MYVGVYRGAGESGPPSNNENVIKSYSCNPLSGVVLGNATLFAEGLYNAASICLCLDVRGCLAKVSAANASRK